MSKVFDGLLSGKYDSTKQRAVLLNGDRLRNYRSYTATMRMELLLTGRLIFTDAQFFDGLYFHWLAANKEELEAFTERMIPFKIKEVSDDKIPPFSISVKCRMPTDLGQSAINTFCKEFQFSSAEDDGLVEAVFDLSKDYSEKYLESANPDVWVAVRGEPEEKNIDGYVNDMKGLLESCYGEQSALVESWKDFSQRLQSLFEIQSVDKWGYRQESGEWYIPNWGDLNTGCFRQSVPKENQTYIEKMEALLNEAEGPKGMDHTPAGCRYFARIRGELNSGVKNRSKITMALSKLEHINNAINKDGNRDCTNKCFQDFRQLLNDRYNKVLACQHGCKFLDLCDYTKVFDLIKSNGKYPIKLSHELIKSLAELPWKDFNNIVSNNDTLEKAFHDWMDAYDGFTLDNIQNIKNKIEQYLNTLTDIFLHVNHGITTLQNERPKEPWNIVGTCNEDIRNIFAKSYQPSPYYLIGGGSFAPGTGDTSKDTEGNEICILCVESGGEAAIEKTAVLRLRLEAESDSTVNSDFDLNTLLAPVCNPLNGGGYIRRVESWAF